MAIYTNQNLIKMASVLGKKSKIYLKYLLKEIIKKIDIY
jgi:hypothetical protein